MSDDVVITGMGILSPIGCSVASFWEGLITGRSGVSPVTSMDTGDLIRQRACPIVEDIDAPIEAGRASQLAATAARDALVDAGLNGKLPTDSASSIVIGTTMGETQFIEDQLFADSKDWLNNDHMRDILTGQPGCIATSVRRVCGGHGSGSDLYGACAAGNMAIAQAARALQSKQCDIALAGGSDGFSRLAFIGFMRLRLTASDACRPFDQNRDGLFVGEGATVFVLERASTAAARGATVHARLAGAAMTAECYHPTRPEPDGDGLTRAIQNALKAGDLSPADIGYVNAHGTGTPQNDMIEARVMDKCLQPGTPFSSTKALTGHMMGAAGATEAAVCVLSLKHQTVIPTWGLENVLEPCSMDAVRDAPRKTIIRAALNNSAGFGGYNSCVVLTAA